MSQHLRSILTEKTATFGSSVEGADWCLKALHPSDPAVQVRGIPDRSSAPTTLLNYQMQATVTAPNTGIANPWDFNSTLIPHPISFLWGFRDQNGAGDQICIRNEQIEGNTHATKMTAFLRTAQRWRLAYAAVTVVQDSSKDSDQGTINVAQVNVEPGVASPAFFSAAGLRPGLPYHYWQTSDLPAYERNAAFPNAYSSDSRAGAYVPLKLDIDAMQWHSQADMVSYAPATSTEASSWGPLVSSTASNSNFPHGTQTDVDSLKAPFFNPTTLVYGGEFTSALCAPAVAHICLQNLAATTSVNLFFRFGFEVQCQATSPLSPLVRMSPVYDPLAMEVYQRISRQMKDAYPADYNDLGKLWDVISRIAKAVAPGLSSIPKVGPLLSLAVPMVASAGDKIRERLSKKKPKKASSTALVLRR